MANAKRYDHHHHHHHQNIQNQKSIFLPMFCRLSVNDVKLNNTLQRNHTPPASEPSSPKVSCMGQVKRNNRVIAYPSVATNHPKHIPNRKKIATGSKTLLPNTAGGSRSCRASREIARGAKKPRRSNSSVKVNDQDLVDVAEMDRPLPVVKKVVSAGAGRDEVNIWKRRFNGAAGGLKSLEIKNIHSPECAFRRPATSSV